MKHIFEIDTDHEFTDTELTFIHRVLRSVPGVNNTVSRREV